MTWLRRLGWATLAITTIAVAIASYVVQLPEPRGAMVLDHAICQIGAGSPHVVSLPNTTPPGRKPDGLERYTIQFDLAARPEKTLFLFIPASNRPLSLQLNGEPLFTSPTILWSGAMIRRATLAYLPRFQLHEGRNTLSIALTHEDMEVPSYLSKLFIGPASVLAPEFRLRIFIEDHLKVLALAAHVLIGGGVLFAYFCRPKDPLFSWLAAMAVVSSVITVGYLVLPEFRPYVIALTPAMGFVTIGLAQTVVNCRPWAIVRDCIWLVPALLLLAMLFGMLPNHLLVAVAFPVLIGGMGLATAIVARGAIHPGGTDARLLLAPVFLSTWFLIHDTAVLLGRIEDTLLFSFYVRPLFLTAILAMLMRRFALTLDRLDCANDDLTQRLAQQEAELAALHSAERTKAARQVREKERQRLTHDLHDGISGHLVSIIAMAERSGWATRPIERTARQALEDLRLVIYSLDTGDRELPLALANFRERLIPQLRRLGVELDWSTADLPEVSGVTPSNALAVLRILQEALTNALKHGPASKIEVLGGSTADGMVSITIVNDGRPFSEGRCGLGLGNMRRRAAELQGELRIMPLSCGTRVTLLLPTRLPDIQEEVGEFAGEVG